MAGEQNLLREAYDNWPVEWDESNDGCRMCDGNVVIGGVQEVLAAIKEKRDPASKPHDKDCLYRRMAEFFGEEPERPR